MNLKKYKAEFFPVNFQWCNHGHAHSRADKRRRKLTGATVSTRKESKSFHCRSLESAKVKSLSHLWILTHFFCFSPWLCSLKLPPLKLKPLPSFPIPLWFGVWVRITVRFQKMLLSTGGKLRDRGTGYIWGHWRVQPGLSLKGISTTKNC